MTAPIGDLISYDPQTGKLFWNPRDLATFKRESRGKAWNSRYAGKEAFTATDANGYKLGSLGNKRVTAHRLIWKLVHGYEPTEVDHINGNRSDNRLANLREASRVENCQNAGRQEHREIGSVGIVWIEQRRKWRSNIKVAYRNLYLGYFETREEAQKARAAAELKYGFQSGHGKRLSHAAQMSSSKLDANR